VIDVERAPRPIAEERSDLPDAVERESPYKSVGGPRRVWNALRYSMRGLAHALRVESAFRQELTLAAVLVPVALLLRLPSLETLALIASVVLVLIVADERKPGRRLFLFIPVLVLWANVHGSVLVGAGLVALYGATCGYAVLQRHEGSFERLLRPAGLVVLPWVCALVSPYGFALPGYYRHFSSNSALQHTITEWAPSSVRSQPFFFVILGAVLFVVFRQRAALSLFAQLAIVATAIGGLLANRNIVWFALATAALVPAALDELWPVRPSERRPRANQTIVAATAALVLIVGGWAATRNRAWFENAYPQPAADIVARTAAANPTFRVYANETFADWLLFEHPSLDGSVSSDIRYELLSDAQIERIAAFESQSGADWRAAATGDRILVLDPQEPAVASYRQGGARTLYADGSVVVLEATAR